MKKGGLLALLGLAGGAFAYWKYKNLSPEEKAALKQKARKVGKDMREAAVDVEQTISEGLDILSDKAKETFDKTTT